MLAVAASVALLTLVLPKVVGVPWVDVMSALNRPTGRQIALLTLLWAAGIVVHARVLTAALPGLTIRRALTLNLTGSAVANVMPLGGGAGIGVNYLMARRWGFSRGQFSLFTGVVNAWHLGAKGILPAAAVLLLIANDKLPGRPLLVGAAGSGIVLAVVLLAAAAVVTHRGARIAGGAADRVLMLRRPATPPATTARLEAARGSAIELLRSAWRPMTWGVIAYNALQLVLLWACLYVVGGPLPWFAVLAVFAVERAATTLPFTPGGAGVVEVAAVAVIVALGGAPAAAAAGILLYRAFVFGLEIPVGGTWLLGWWITQRGAVAA